MKITRLDCQEELEIVRPKATKKHTDLNQREKMALSVVYDEINYRLTGKHHVLNIGCSSCIMSAINQVHNFIMFHEVREEVSTKEANVTIVTDSTKAYENMTLKELRELFPNIKSTSKEGFIKQIV